VALAASPMAERLFQQVTSLTILEALSYDHQLLRDLMTKAPGTFLHSTNVSLLTDAAARAINADALAVRVGALYHDVGKTAHPEFFIENQEHGEGAVVDEDALSAAERGRILASHVTDGVAMVLKHGLGERVAIFVREHHGTSRMRSLIDRARRDGTVDADLLRYPGPRPQCRETALLMMADQIEASARSTPLPTLEACLAFARRATERIRAEGQLAESGMSDGDLEAAIQAFGGVLHAIHHRRFGYPEAPVSRHGAPVIAGLRD
jgi:putative nucleotidyltransferase with HDIG domain